MPGVFRRCILSFVCFALLGGCVDQGTPHPAASEPQPVDRSPQTRAETTTPAQIESSEYVGDDGEQDVVTNAAGQAAHRIRYKFRPDRPLYYIIENEFLDHGGVPALLTFTTQVNDKRTLIQRMDAAQTPPQRSPQRSTAKGLSVRLTWDCDRYEAREESMKADVEFDSLRDTYPRVALRGLGGIPGSRVSFDYNRASRAFGNPRIVQGASAGPPTHKKLSRTTQKCELNKENLDDLFDDLSSLFLPIEPMPVGGAWSARRTDIIKNFGQSVTDYTFTLTEVREQDGRKIALIHVDGDVHLEQAEAAKPKRPGAASAPARSQPAKAKSQQRDFKIDRAVCTGSIEFDITRGELIRLVLRRQLDLTAELESKDNQKVALETGSSHVLRVAVRDTPPPKPIIVGGPKDPPAEPVADARRGRGPQGRATPKKRGAATRPATPRTPPPIADPGQLKPHIRSGKKSSRLPLAKPVPTAHAIEKASGGRRPTGQGEIVGPPDPRSQKPVGDSKNLARPEGTPQPGIRPSPVPAPPTPQPTSRPASK